MKRTGQSKIAVVGWGRGMGHKGHMYLADAVIEQARIMNADPYFFVSKTVGKDDPIFPEEKVKIYQKVFPQHATIFAAEGNLNQALTELAQQGYQGVVVVVGADQKQAFQYLAKPNKEGVPVYQTMGLKKLRVISRQETPSQYAQEEGPRATPMREILLSPDASEQDKFKVWRRDMPEQLSDEMVLELMHKAESRMLGAKPVAKTPKVNAMKKVTNKPLAESVQGIANDVAELLYNVKPEIFSRFGDDFVMDAITQACEQHQGSAQEVAVKVVDILKQGISEATRKPRKPAAPQFTKYTNYELWERERYARGANYSETEIDGRLVGVAVVGTTYNEWGYVRDAGKVVGMWYNKASIGSFVQDGTSFDDSLSYAEQDTTWPYMNESQDVTESTSGKLPGFLSYVLANSQGQFGDIEEIEDLFDYAYLSDLDLETIADGANEEGVSSLKWMTPRMAWLLKNINDKSKLVVIKPLAASWMKTVAPAIDKYVKDVLNDLDEGLGDTIVKKAKQFSKYMTEPNTPHNSQVRTRAKNIDMIRKKEALKSVFEKDPEAKREFERAGGYEAGIDVMGWQVGWAAARLAKGDTMKQAFQKLYYGGGSSFPFSERAFKLAWVAYNKHYGPEAAIEEAISASFPKPSDTQREPTWSFAEIAQKLKITPEELIGLRNSFGFPKKVEGLKSWSGSKAYFRQSEVKRWVNSNDIRNIIKSKQPDLSEAYDHNAPFNAADFNRHMEQLRAREELRKTDPMKALVGDLIDKEHEKERLSKRKPQDDDSMSTSDPRHPQYAYTQAGQHNIDEDSDLPIQVHKSPYEGSDDELRYTTMFLASPNSAQRFAKHIISKGGKARIGKRGQDYYVYHNMPMSKEDWRKSEQQELDESPEEALKYATQAHAGQTRSGGDPYITHPMRVADHIRQYKQSHNLDALISAAYLHDTIEDTDTTQEVLHDLFGGLVASLVKELTSDPEQIKKMGKAAYLSHKMAVMSSYGLVIKLADRLDNVKDITTARTPEWRAKYAKETNQILDYIEKTRALSGTHKKLISLIRAKLAEIDNPQQGVTEVGQNFRRGNSQRAAVDAMSPEERKAHEDKRAEQQRKRDDARMERERQRNAAKKGVAEAEGISRRGILKGLGAAMAAGAAGKASAIAGAFPTPSAQQAMYKAAADSNRAEAKRQAELKAKADAERLQKNTDQVDKEQRINHHKLDEFAPGNGDDGLPYAEYQVYQCNPEDQFDWIGGPLYQTDSMGMAHKYAYEKYVKHRPKAFMVWQERSQGSRGNYGVKGESDHNEDGLNEDYLDEK